MIDSMHSQHSQQLSTFYNRLCELVIIVTRKGKKAVGVTTVGETIYWVGTLEVERHLKAWKFTDLVLGLTGIWEVGNIGMEGLIWDITLG
jgi:hypothetical protein